MIADLSYVARAAAAKTWAVSAVRTVAGAPAAIVTADRLNSSAADKDVQYLARPNANDAVDTTTAGKLAASCRAAHDDADLPHALGN